MFLLVAAKLKNHLTWQFTSEGDPVLDLDVELNVSLEVTFVRSFLSHLRSALAAMTDDIIFR